MARAEQRMRIEALESKALEEHGIEPDTLREEYGPDSLVPPSPVAATSSPTRRREPYPYVRADQEKRLQELALLGKVNPLALEEFSALEERHVFLTEQLDDLKRSRTELLAIVKDVDERVQQVFAEAYADTEREFERIFPDRPRRRGAPGADRARRHADTGIEIEARPARQEGQAAVAAVRW